MQETWVRSLGWEDLMEEGMATHSSIFAWKITMDGGAWWATVYGVAKSQTQLSDQAQHMPCHESRKKENYVRKHKFKYFKASTQKTQQCLRKQNQEANIS